MLMSACSPEEPGIVVLTTWVFVLEYTERVVCASWLSAYSNMQIFTSAQQLMYTTNNNECVSDSII